MKLRGTLLCIQLMFATHGKLQFVTIDPVAGQEGPSHCAFPIIKSCTVNACQRHESTRDPAIKAVAAYRRMPYESCLSSLSCVKPKSPCRQPSRRPGMKDRHCAARRRVKKRKRNEERKHGAHAETGGQAEGPQPYKPLEVGSILK